MLLGPKHTQTQRKKVGFLKETQTLQREQRQRKRKSDRERKLETYLKEKEEKEKGKSGLDYGENYNSNVTMFFF